MPLTYSRNIHEIYMVTNLKVCSACKISKPLENFTKNKVYCRQCVSKQFKAWRLKNLDKILKKDRIKHYTRTYGFTYEQAKKFVENRIGICEICKQESPLVVDHNHITKAIRGFICSFCNSLLGYSRESKEILQSTMIYLEQYK